MTGDGVGVVGLVMVGSGLENEGAGRKTGAACCCAGLGVCTGGAGRDGGGVACAGGLAPD